MHDVRVGQLRVYGLRGLRFELILVLREGVDQSGPIFECMCWMPEARRAPWTEWFTLECLYGGTVLGEMT